MSKEKITNQIIDLVTSQRDSQGMITETSLQRVVGEALEKYAKEQINTPQFGNFNDAVAIEMKHHEERWGDESKSPPHHFQMVLSLIFGKLVKATFDSDVKKFEHHLITIAAVAGTAHKYLKTQSSVSRWFT